MPAAVGLPLAIQDGLTVFGEVVVPQVVATSRAGLGRAGEPASGFHAVEGRVEGAGCDGAFTTGHLGQGFGQVQTVSLTPFQQAEQREFEIEIEV